MLNLFTTKIFWSHISPLEASLTSYLPHLPAAPWCKPATFSHISLSVNTIQHNNLLTGANESFFGKAIIIIILIASDAEVKLKSCELRVCPPPQHAGFWPSPPAWRLHSPLRCAVSHSGRWMGCFGSVWVRGTAHSHVRGCFLHLEPHVSSLSVT